MKTTLISLGLLALGLSACTESNTGDFLFTQYDMAPSDMPTVDMSGPPAPPVIGTQLDRVGRPLINLLLVNPFEQTLTGTGAGSKTAMQDNYNTSAQAANPLMWVPYYGGRPWLADALAFWDGVDGSCTNQVMSANGTNYGTLGAILAADALLVDTTKMVCNRYLAIELGDQVNCGGRQPDITGVSTLGTTTVNNNVIDTTLNVLIGQQTVQTNTYANSVIRDADGVPPTANTTLPFLLGPS